MPLCIMYNIPDEFSSALWAIAGRKSSFGSSIFILFLFRVCIGGVLLLLSQKKNLNLFDLHMGLSIDDSRLDVYIPAAEK